MASVPNTSPFTLQNVTAVVGGTSLSLLNFRNYTEPSNAISVSPTSYNFPKAGGTTSFTVTATGAWTASWADGTYFLSSKMSASGSTTFTISCQTNNEGVILIDSFTLVLTADPSKTATINITQAK